MKPSRDATRKARMFGFLTCLLNLKPKATQPVAPPAVEIGDGEEAPTKGCGWFDSSHELRHGLVVTEHASADAVASALPPAHWLELHRSGWRAPCVAG